jgi:hypothetical protein
MGGGETMNDPIRRSTVHFEGHPHRTLRSKASHTRRSLSELANGAVRRFLREDEQDLAVSDARGKEPLISSADLTNDLRRRWKIKRRVRRVGGQGPAGNSIRWRSTDSRGRGTPGGGFTELWL